MEKKYIPGPWKIVENESAFCWGRIDGRGTVCPLTGAKTEQSEANAHLISAAAPDLLEALDNLIGHFCAFTPSEKEAKVKAINAITKARGGNP